MVLEFKKYGVLGNKYLVAVASIFSTRMICDSFFAKSQQEMCQNERPL